MAQPTPRADALRQMREAKFEAEQKRRKQETAEGPTRKPDAATAPGAAQPELTGLPDQPVAAKKPTGKPVKKTAAASEARVSDMPASAEDAGGGAADAGPTVPAAGKAAMKAAAKTPAAKTAKTS